MITPFGPAGCSIFDSRYLGSHGREILPSTTRPARAGDAGKIAGQAVHRAVGEDGEGDGFFCIHVEAEFVGAVNAQAGQEFGEARHQQAIVGAAAGNNERGGWAILPGTKRSSASVMVRAVNSVAVRSKSFDDCRLTIDDLPSQPSFSCCGVGRYPVRERIAR